MMGEINNEALFNEMRWSLELYNDAFGAGV